MTNNNDLPVESSPSTRSLEFRANEPYEAERDPEELMTLSQIAKELGTARYQARKVLGRLDVQIVGMYRNARLVRRADIHERLRLPGRLVTEKMELTNHFFFTEDEIAKYSSMSLSELIVKIWNQDEYVRPLIGLAIKKRIEHRAEDEDIKTISEKLGIVESQLPYDIKKYRINVKNERRARKKTLQRAQEAREITPVEFVLQVLYNHPKMKTVLKVAYENVLADVGGKTNVLANELGIARWTVNRHLKWLRANQGEDVAKVEIEEDVRINENSGQPNLTGFNIGLEEWSKYETEYRREKYDFGEHVPLHALTKDLVVLYKKELTEGVARLAALVRLRSSGLGFVKGEQRDEKVFYFVEKTNVGKLLEKATDEKVLALTPETIEGIKAFYNLRSIPQQEAKGEVMRLDTLFEDRHHLFPDARRFYEARYLLAHECPDEIVLVDGHIPGMLPKNLPKIRAVLDTFMDGY